MNVQEIKVVSQERVTGEAATQITEVYREAPGIAQSPIDVLTQLAANISSLENLQSQMSFMVREIQTLTMKRR